MDRTPPQACQLVVPPKCHRMIPAAHPTEFALLECRLLWVHWCNLPFGALSLFCFVVAIRMKLMIASRTQMIAFTIISIVNVLGCLGLFAWTMELDITLRRLAKLISRRMSPATVFPDTTYGDCPPDQTLAQKNPGLQRWRGRQRSGIKNLQGQIQLAFQVCLFSVAFGSPILVGILSLVRLGFVISLLCAADQPCDFQDLQATTAGFGLLVDAWDLQKAVKAFLSGGIV